MVNRRRFRTMIYWYVSFRCNLACKHCWVNSSPDVDTSEDLTTEEMIAAVHNIKRLNPSGVILTGGEPLLRKDIGVVLRELVRQDMDVFVETNATLVADEVLASAREAITKGQQFHFAVSLDGGTEESHDWLRGRGSFRGTLRGIRRLREEGLPVDIQCVVHRRNWDTLNQLGDLAQKLDICYLKFGVATPIGRAKEQLSDLIVPYNQTAVALTHIIAAIARYSGKVLLKIPPAMIPLKYQQELRSKGSVSDCSAQNVTSCHFPLLGILPDGRVTVCAITREQTSAYFGNIRDVSLLQIWQTHSLDAQRERYLSAELKGICADCIFNNECRGACRAHAYTETGSFEGPYPICAEMERQGFFPNVFRLSWVEKMRWRLPTTAGATEGGGCHAG